MITHNITWLSPQFCAPPHKLTHPEKYQELYEVFLKEGWGKDYPALLGYPFFLNHQNSSIIQLISGTHRWFAALKAGIMIPVVIHDFSFIQKIWGTDDWVEFLKNPPVVTE